MTFVTNPQLDLAFEYVRNTNKHVFLTGKAGTGKTTFLHMIKEESSKRMGVTAPTGVAAINAGGMTLHSFFQLPLGLHLPGTSREANSSTCSSSMKSAWCVRTCSMPWTRCSGDTATPRFPSAASNC
jgi:hypothetical protein